MNAKAIFNTGTEQYSVKLDDEWLTTVTVENDREHAVFSNQAVSVAISFDTDVVMYTEGPGVSDSLRAQEGRDGELVYRLPDEAQYSEARVYISETGNTDATKPEQEQNTGDELVTHTPALEFFHSQEFKEEARRVKSLSCADTVEQRYDPRDETAVIQLQYTPGGRLDSGEQTGKRTRFQFTGGVTADVMLSGTSELIESVEQEIKNATEQWKQIFENSSGRGGMITTQYQQNAIEEHPEPLNWLASDMIAQNEQIYLRGSKRGTNGAKQVREYGLTTNQRHWVEEIAAMLDEGWKNEVLARMGSITYKEWCSEGPEPGSSDSGEIHYSRTRAISVTDDGELTVQGDEIGHEECTQCGAPVERKTNPEGFVEDVLDTIHE